MTLSAPLASARFLATRPFSSVLRLLFITALALTVLVPVQSASLHQQGGEGEASDAAASVAVSSVSFSSPSSSAAASIRHAHVTLSLGMEHDTNGTVAAFDELNDIGVSHAAKLRIWSAYVGVNLAGTLLCSMLIWGVVRLPSSSRSSSDILVAALCFSCMWMSFSCGVQCLLNVSGGRFSFGERACYWQAVMHLISILTMFATLTLMSFDTWRTVVHGKSLGARQALLWLALIWVAASGGLLLLSLVSPIYSQYSRQGQTRSSRWHTGADITVAWTLCLHVRVQWPIVACFASSLSILL
jgi:hypothetical protein